MPSRKPLLSVEEVLAHLRDDPDAGKELEDPFVARFLQAIEEMLQDGTFAWAENMLEGIYATVEEKRFVTAGQRSAVNNVRERRKWDEIV